MKLFIELFGLSIKKFNYKIGQNIIVIITIAISCLSLLVTQISKSAIEKNTSSIIDTTQDYFAVERFSLDNESSYNGYPKITKPLQQLESEYKKDFNIKKAYETKIIEGLEPKLSKNAEKTRSVLKFFPKELVNEDLQNQFNIDNNESTIPALVSTELLLNLDNNQDKFTNSKDKFEKIKSIKNEYSNKEIDLFIDKSDSDTAEDTNIKIKIIGTVDYGLVLPLETYPKFETKYKQSSQSFNEIYLEFSSKEDLEKVTVFGDIKTKERIFGIASGSTVIGELFNFYSQISYGLSLLFAIISLVLIINLITKTILESKKEIAVLQTVGVSNFGINLSYLMYTSILLTVGYFLSVILSYILLFFTSIFYGDKYLLWVINYATNFNNNLSDFIFLDFPILYIFIVYFLIIIVGFCITLFALFRVNSRNLIATLKEY